MAQHSPTPATWIYDRPEYAVIPMRKHIQQFRQKMKRFEEVEELIQHMLYSYMASIANFAGAREACMVEVDLLVDDFRHTPTMFEWKVYRESAITVFDALFHELCFANAFDSDGHCPYIYHAMSMDDLVLEHYDTRTS